MTKTLTDRTVGGVLWVFSGTVSQALLSMIVMIVLARLLSPTEFGTMGAALVVVGFSQIFSHLGIGPAVVQRPNLTAEHVRVGFTISTAMGLFVGLVFYLSAPLLARFFRIEELERIVQVLAVVFPVTGISVVGQALLQREMQFKRLAAIGLLSYAVGYGMIGILLAVLNLGVWALVGANLGQAVVYTSILLLVKREAAGFSLRRGEMRQLLNFGAGFSLAKIANYSATQADNLVVGRWLGAEALGVYGRAYQFLMFPANLLGSVVDKVIFPAMASVQDDRTRLGRAYARAVAIVAMLSLPLSGTLIVLAPEIVLVLLGPQWMDSVLPFQVLAAGLVFRTGYKMSDSLARATGAVYRRAWRQCFYAAAVFGGAWVGQFWGLVGVSCGVVVAITLNFLLMLHLSASLATCSWRELGRIHVRYAVIGGVVGGNVWLLKTLLGGFDARHPALIAGGGLAVAIVTVLGLWLTLPGLFGEEGLWLISLLKRHGQAAAVRFGWGRQDTSSRILVYLNGYPGSGKTWFADSLINEFRRTGEYPVRKFIAPTRRWKTRPWILTRACLRHCCLLIRLTRLILSVKGSFKRRVLAQSLRDAIRLINNFYSLRALRKMHGKEIVLIDEPIQHQLWIKMFPAPKEPPPKLLRKVMKSFICQKNIECKEVFICFTVPVDICISRFKNRLSKGSRFNKKISEEMLSLLRNDILYPLLLHTTLLTAESNSLFIEDADKLTKEDIVKKIIQFANSAERPKNLVALEQACHE